MNGRLNASDIPPATDLGAPAPAEPSETVRRALAIEGDAPNTSDGLHTTTVDGGLSSVSR